VIHGIRNESDDIFAIPLPTGGSETLPSLARFIKSLFSVRLAVPWLDDERDSNERLENKTSRMQLERSVLKAFPVCVR
jgi:hypothetical protein